MASTTSRSAPSGNRYTVSPIPPFHGGRSGRIQPKKTTNVIGSYILFQTLGEGEFGKVKLGMHMDGGEEAAIKLIKKESVDTPARLAKVQREISVLRACNHPHIVKLYDVIENENYIAIVLEYASGGELFDHILAHRYLKERDACRLFAQLISGVSYMHSKNIVHRDLKLENLLLDRQRNLIITDFGFANQFGPGIGQDLMATSCGSPCYAAPELVVSEGKYIGTAVDIWSCGVILYAMLAGFLPYDDDPSNPDGDNINRLYEYIVSTPLTFPNYIGSGPVDLLRKMLVPDPKYRCDMALIMSHSWLLPFAAVCNTRGRDEVHPVILAPEVPDIIEPDVNPEETICEVPEQELPPSSKRHTIQLEYTEAEKVVNAKKDTVNIEVSQPAEKVSISEFPQPPKSGKLTTPKERKSRTPSPNNKKNSKGRTRPTSMLPPNTHEESLDKISPLPKSSPQKKPARSREHDSKEAKEEKKKRDERRNTLNVLSSTTKNLLSNLGQPPKAPAVSKAHAQALTVTGAKEKRRKAYSAVIETNAEEISGIINNPNRTEVQGNSNAAKRVMDWFRRKSASKYAGDAILGVSSVLRRLSNDRESIDLRIREHKGAVDQGALTTRLPVEVMHEIYIALEAMGCEVTKESEYKYKCSRPKQKRTSDPEYSRARSTTMHSGTAWKRATMLKLLSMKPAEESDASAMVSSSSSTQPERSERAETERPATKFPTIYGEPSIDSGEEIRFSVELCKMKNLKELYIVDVRRLRGSVWTYKFVYHNFIERLDLKSKGYINMN